MALHNDAAFLRSVLDVLERKDEAARSLALRVLWVILRHKYYHMTKDPKKFAEEKKALEDAEKAKGKGKDSHVDMDQVVDRLKQARGKLPEAVDKGAPAKKETKSGGDRVPPTAQHQQSEVFG